MFKENIIMHICFKLRVLFSPLQLHTVENMEKVNIGRFSTLFLLSCFQWQTVSSSVLFLTSLEMPFLQVWLAHTADLIPAEGIRNNVVVFCFFFFCQRAPVNPGTKCGSQQLALCMLFTTCGHQAGRWPPHTR